RGACDRIATRRKLEVSKQERWNLEKLSDPAGLALGNQLGPDIIFGLQEEDIDIFLEALWDRSGYSDEGLPCIEAASKRLVFDVQVLLLRLGIASTGAGPAHFASLLKSGRNGELRPDGLVKSGRNGELHPDGLLKS